jgi:hypothetical protein
MLLAFISMPKRFRYLCEFEKQRIIVEVREAKNVFVWFRINFRELSARAKVLKCRAATNAES